MLLRGLFTDLEVRGDGLVPGALDNEIEDAALTRGERAHRPLFVQVDVFCGHLHKYGYPTEVYVRRTVRGGTAGATALSALELVSWASQLLFLLLAAASIATAVRRPRPATIDAALFFGLLAAVIVESRVATFFGLERSPELADLLVVLLMGVSYLLLRLANDFVAVPRPALRAAELGLMAIVVAVVVIAQTSLPVPVIVVLLAYFAIVTIGAAVVFVRASLRARGVSRRRLRAIAFGSYLLGGSIAIAGVSVFIPPLAGVSGTLIQVGALLSAISFGIGFIPPKPLRRVWQLSELRHFLRSAGA